MEKLKSSGDTLDRLSELPDSLILEILSLLKMRDVVRTTLLSKRWKYFWITIPCLQFHEGGDSVNTRNFVSRVLALWRGTSLRKFSINLSGCSDASLASDVDLWVLFAIERNVEELCISFYSHVSFYRPPQCLYECSSIRKLSLSHCNLQIHGDVQWDRLNCLELCNCISPEDSVNKVFSCSPRLETFKFTNPVGCLNLSVRSISLKSLLVRSGCRELSVMTINAPNLEALQLLGRPYSKYVLTNVSSLTEVRLNSLAYAYTLVGEVLCQILPAIQHAVSVRLSSCFFKFIGVVKGNYSFPPLLNINCLRIGGPNPNGRAELSDLVCLFEIFPKLKTLIIYWGPFAKLFEFNAEGDIISEANVLISNLLHLRTVEITWNSYKASMFQFIEFLLKHATMIEKIVIQKKRRCVVKSKNVFLAEQKVRSLQRSFPSVELVLC